MKVSYTLTCVGCRKGYYSNEAFPKPQYCVECDTTFRAGIREVVNYYSRHWMGQTRGMLLYEIPSKDRDLLEDGIVPKGKEDNEG